MRRLLSRHIGKHIPGHPIVVVQNMPGAGSVRAAQHVYSLAPKDGTAIATFGRQMGIAPLLQTAMRKYDGTKFNWLGSITNEVTTCITWHTAAVKTWNDLLDDADHARRRRPGRRSRRVRAPLQATCSTPSIKLVSGYHGTTPLVLAMERGEIGWVLRLFLEHDQEQAPCNG